MSLKPTRLLAIALLASSASLAHAQAQPEPTNRTMDPAQLQAMVQLGAQMHALAAECGSYTADELTELKAEQRQASGNLGMDGPTFDQTFQEAHDATQAQLKSASADQVKQACDQAEAMRQAQPVSPPAGG